MKRLLIAAAAGALCATAQADPGFHPSGANLTYGVNSVSQSAVTSNNNPAAAAAALHQVDDTRFRMGIITLGAGYEVGQVDNFVDDLDRLIEATDTLTLDEALAVARDTATPNEDNLLDEFNAILPDVAEDGYLSTTVAAHLPLTPLIIASDMFGGAISLDISGAANVKAMYLDDGVARNGGGTPYSPVDPDNPTPAELAALLDDTLTAQQSRLFVQGGTVGEIAVGYSTSLLKSNSGTLYAGVKGKYLAASMGREVALIDNADDVDTVMEGFDDNAVDSSAITADVGVLWVGNNYQLGATLMNVTSPSFEYRDLSNDVDCSLFTGAAQQQRCNDALSDNEYNLDANVRLEAALHSESRNWLVTLAYDTVETETPAGDLQQWAVASVAFAPESWVIPGVRLGYRQNMTGTELSYGTFGLSLFKGLSIDLAMALDSTEVDGESVPRGAMANIAFEMRF